jgi:hypothetical protein
VSVLFTDIVGATEKTAAIGDRRWHDVLDGYDAVARRELARFRGRGIDTAGDGVFAAAFDGPARGVRCARAISLGVRSLGIEIRAGLHTGECEVIGDKVGGLAVHTGSRVASKAAPGEVLVLSTVKDLVAGSRLRFEDRGRDVSGLKGTEQCSCTICDLPDLHRSLLLWRRSFSRRSPGRRRSRNRGTRPAGWGTSTGAGSSGSRPCPPWGPKPRRCHSRRPSRTVRGPPTCPRAG